jgi:hypothetical protein
MHKIVTMTDVPDDDVDRVMRNFRLAGAETVTKVQQDSGHWIVTAIFPDHVDDEGDGAGAGATDNDSKDASPSPAPAKTKKKSAKGKGGKS